ncbi:hypothetical protein BFL38_07360 [Brachyspira hampsonii]|uniref:Abortive phage infection protein C-terminal domain-containing protein n=1 Tax=Brachyspira hampsonii TaxID=1287055 RepID=A0A1E5NEQ3_9SPIR|nr:AIPR family protein [Brachyspira hampsonii]OEJ14652.1 hypothetical protein BFL38_07360 [Brachyspira hampsonii]
MNKLENQILKKHLIELSNKKEIQNFLEQRKIKGDNIIPYCFNIYTLQNYIGNYSVEILNDITDGPNDNNIDIFYIDDDDYDDIIINLFQVKYHNDQNLSSTIGSRDINDFLNSIKKIFIDKKLNSVNFNDFFSKKYKQFEDLPIEKVHFNLFLVTNGNDITDLDKIKLSEFQEEHSNLFEINVITESRFFLNKNKLTNRTHILNLNTKDCITINTGILSYIVNVNTYEICKLYSEIGDDILNKNIRKLLKTSLNKEIEKSIINDPEMFWYKNNGISIICKRAEKKTLKGQTIMELEDPYIVNGGQTSKILYNIFKKDETNEIFVTSSILLRIYQTTDDQKIEQIVIGTNNQNKITMFDLKSNIKNLKTLKEYFAIKNISLIIERNSEENLLEKHIISEKLLQIYCSIYMDIPHEAKRAKNYLVNKYYSEVYKRDDIYNDLLISFYIYDCIIEKYQNSNYEHVPHSLYSVLFFMTKILPELKKNFDENKTIEIFNIAMDKINNIVQQYRNDNIKTFTYTNFFKSQKSTEIILEYIK